MIFKDDQSLERHLSHEVCERDLNSTLDGISWTQRFALSKRFSSNLSHEQQWYSIWEILFPSIPRPQSPYVDLVLAEQIYSFREFCNHKRLTILRQLLEVVGPDSPLKDIISTIFANAENILYDEWYSKSGRLCQGHELSLTSSGNSTQSTQHHTLATYQYLGCRWTYKRRSPPRGGCIKFDFTERRSAATA